MAEQAEHTEKEEVAEHAIDEEVVEYVIDKEVLRSRIAAHFGLACELELYQQGSHHLTFLITMGDGDKLFARVHYPFFRPFGAGVTPPSKMPSEIATIKFVREHTSIPVPAVFVHDADADGAVGGEWMVQEYIEGAALFAIWPELSIEQRRGVAESIADVWSQLTNLRFSKIGSIYEDAEGNFDIGPMTFMPSNNRNDTHPPDPAKCGPFESAKEWLLAVAAGDLDYTKSLVRDAIQHERIDTLLRDIRTSTIFDSELSQRLTMIALEHVDITVGNIIVDPKNPTVITGVIDWEGARTVPLWAMEPRFFSHCQYIDETQQIVLQAITREAVRQIAPDWCDATEEPGRELRFLHTRAQYSDWDPEQVHLYEHPTTV